MGTPTVVTLDVGQGHFLHVRRLRVHVEIVALESVGCVRVPKAAIGRLIAVLKRAAPLEEERE